MGPFVFAFTGATAPWWEEVARLRAGGDPDATLSAEFDLLRYEQLRELRARLDVRVLGARAAQRRD